MSDEFIFLQGNQENRAVLINNKVIDYINFILRRTAFDEDCTAEQVRPTTIRSLNIHYLLRPS